ncbi:hypothetical protein M9434_001376 [Picochlorum sp. BPE23]|nr:hypothetical protein M9434_001376 [Picochlorum sp. BPE23]
MAENVLRDIGNRDETVVMQQAVPAKPTASQHRSSDKTESLGTTRKKKKNSRAKRKPGVRRAAYKYRCPCIKCVGKDVSISYKSARDHIKEAKGRYRRAHKSKGLTEAYRNRLMEERRRMDDFEADLFKYIAAEEGSRGNQMQAAPAEVVQQNHDYSPDMECEDLGGCCDYDCGPPEPVPPSPDHESDEEDQNSDSGQESASDNESDEENSDGEELVDSSDYLADAEGFLHMYETTHLELTDFAGWLTRDIGILDCKMIAGDLFIELLRHAVKSGWAKHSIFPLFDIIKKYLPGSASSNEVQSLIRRAGSIFTPYVTCNNHHELIEKKKAEQETIKRGCPTCGLPLKKDIRHCSIKTILKREMQDATFAECMRYGPALKEQKSGYISSVWEGDYMKRMREDDSIGPDLKMAAGYIPVVIEIFTDGLAAFNKAYHSEWAIMMKILNLPPWMACRLDNIYPLVIVDGPKEPDNLDQYLGMVVDELEWIGKHGITVYDAASKTEVLLKVFLLCSAQDGRAMRLVPKRDEAGSQYPCHICNVKGESIGSGGRGSHRVVYGVPSQHQLEDKHFYKSDATVRAMADNIEKMLDKMQIDEIDASVRMGVRGNSVLQRLPYMDMVKGFLICSMHGISNVGQRAENTVMGSNDNVAMRRLLQVKGMYPESWIDKAATTVTGAKKPPYIMNKPLRSTDKNLQDQNRYADKNETMARTYLTFIKPPSNFHGKPARLFKRMNQTSKQKKQEDNDSNAVRKKAADYKDFAISGIMCAGMYFGGVREDIIRAYDAIFQAFKILSAPVVNRKEVEELEKRMPDIMRQMQLHLPPTEMLSSLHNLMHLPRQVLDFGPLRDTSSWVFESKNGQLKRLPMKRSAVGASLANRISLESLTKLLYVMLSNRSDSDAVPKSNLETWYSDSGTNLLTFSPTNTITDDIPKEERYQLYNLMEKIVRKNDITLTEFFRMLARKYPQEMESESGRDLNQYLRNYSTTFDDLHNVVRLDEVEDEDKEGIWRAIWNGIKACCTYHPDWRPGTFEEMAFRAVALREYSIVKHKWISIGSVKIQPQDGSRREETDNSLLLLRQTQPSSNPIPIVATVHGLYTFKIPFLKHLDFSKERDETTLLLVRRFKVVSSWPVLKDVYTLELTEANKGDLELIGIDRILDQAFLSPNNEKIHGTRQNTGFHHWLVHTKGTLRNMDLSSL